MEKNFNALCGIDEFGRTIMPYDSIDEKKKVGIFYFCWLGQLGDKEIYDIEKLLKKDPESLWDVKGPDESPAWGFHYWGEPLYGYYNSEERFVIRKHIELLSAAGIDYILFDNTNAQIYPQVILNIMEELERYQKEGVKVPKVACYTNSGSVQTVQIIWEIFYKEKNLHPDVWYSPNGKPVIVATSDLETEDPKMYEFFDVWVSQWPNEKFSEKGLPWMEWTYPQPIHKGVVSVSVAQHAKGIFYTQKGNWGRGYDHEGNDNHDTFRLGQNFQKQWDTAINNEDVNEVFVTGWNEWGAQKLNLMGETGFCDCFSEEYSRDVEMMRGGYGDAFYMQMINNIRKFKKATPFTQSAKMKEINISEGLAQWDDVKNIYLPQTSDNYSRDSFAYDNKIHYHTDPAENNITEVRVSHDKNNIYFLIKTENDITESRMRPGWMNVFISAGTPKKQGWEGYKFVANRRCAGSLDELNCAGFTVSYAKTDYIIEKNTMQLVIPRDIIGADATEGFYFKVADSVKDPFDISEYYVSGSVLPAGRLSWYYKF
ncbi:MAG: hypothetical protein DBX47_01360 [Clostridiales bacterium]|nr:MAG: hypothetical protein DBX47_01360 [Clostridiales bacterium]